MTAIRFVRDTPCLNHLSNVIVRCMVHTIRYMMLYVYELKQIHEGTLDFSVGWLWDDEFAQCRLELLSIGWYETG